MAQAGLGSRAARVPPRCPPQPGGLYGAARWGAAAGRRGHRNAIQSRFSFRPKLARRPAGGGTEGSWASSQGRRKPSPVIHWAGSGYVFGCRNLLGALSRMGDGGILDVVTTVVASFSESLSLWCCRRPSGVRPRLAGVVWYCRLPGTISEEMSMKAKVLDQISVMTKEEIPDQQATSQSRGIPSTIHNGTLDDTH
uniref:Uncharacterized protein n=2 Tax=Oryza meridionalis TaxID=40149 RepID=A0A0E0E707_9ORYZ